MSIVEVNHNTCIKCGMCAAVCPAKLFDFQTGKFPLPVAFIDTTCIRCGHCVTICPTGSITHQVIPIEKCLPVQNELQISPEQCEYLLKSRRSIRVYRKKSVSKDIITKLIEIARYAPTAKNSQDVEWLVIDNRDELNKIKKAVADWLRWFVMNHPELAGPMDMQRLLARQESGKDELLHDAPVLIIAHGQKNDPFASDDCTIALTYLQLAAMSMGLGTCWVGFIKGASEFPAVKEAISLPEGHANYGSMLLGYSKYTYHRIPTRKPPDITWR